MIPIENIYIDPAIPGLDFQHVTDSSLQYQLAAAQEFVFQRLNSQVPYILDILRYYESLGLSVDHRLKLTLHLCTGLPATFRFRDPIYNTSSIGYRDSDVLIAEPISDLIAPEEATHLVHHATSDFNRAETEALNGYNPLLVNAFNRTGVTVEQLAKESGLPKVKIISELKQIEENMMWYRMIGEFLARYGVLTHAIETHNSHFYNKTLSDRYPLTPQGKMFPFKYAIYGVADELAQKLFFAYIRENLCDTLFKYPTDDLSYVMMLLLNNNRFSNLVGDHAQATRIFLDKKYA